MAETEYEVGDIVRLIGSEWNRDYLNTLAIITSIDVKRNMLVCISVKGHNIYPLIRQKEAKFVAKSSQLEKIIFNIP